MRKASLTTLVVAGLCGAAALAAVNSDPITLRQPEPARRFIDQPVPRIDGKRGRNDNRPRWRRP